MNRFCSWQTIKSEPPPNVSVDNIFYHLSCIINCIVVIMLIEKKVGKKKLLTSSVLTISFAMKRRIFNGTDGFPNLLCRNFIQRGRSTGTTPWKLKETSKNQLNYWTKQVYHNQKTSLPEPHRYRHEKYKMKEFNQSQLCCSVITSETMPNFWFILASTRGEWCSANPVPPPWHKAVMADVPSNAAVLTAGSSPPSCASAPGTWWCSSPMSSCSVWWCWPGLHPPDGPRHHSSALMSCSSQLY